MEISIYLQNIFHKPEDTNVTLKPVRELNFHSDGVASHRHPRETWERVTMEIGLDAPKGRLHEQSKRMAMATDEWQEISVVLSADDIRSYTESGFGAYIRKMFLDRPAAMRPASVRAFELSGGLERPVVFDVARGWHRVNLDDVEPIVPPGGSEMRNDAIERVRLVLSNPADSEQPVRRIHSQSLVKVEAGDLCIEALFKMYHYRIHHLLVLDNGRPKGIVTTHDLMKLQGKSPVSIVREIEERHSLTELVSPVRRLHDLLGHFLDEGVKATHVLRIASEICDRLLCKVLEMAQKSTGPSPLPWCFLVYGNRGRQEQVSPGLENSAVVYANPRSEEEERLVHEYFRRFSFSVRRKFAEIAALSGSGAGTEDHDIRCQSLATWENTFSRWIEMTQPAAMAQVVEMFDYRCLYGDRRLADDLDRSIRALLAANPEFFRTMAAAVLDNSPPLPGSSRSMGEPPLPDDFSPTHHGVTPLVDIVRLLALENRVWETSTPERLRLLGDLPTPIHQGAELTTAFDVICGCSLYHQYQRMRQGRLHSPRQDAAQLNNLERKILHEAFVVVGKMQGLLRERFAL